MCIHGSADGAVMRCRIGNSTDAGAAPALLAWRA
jgi:hypothetical protein